MWQLLLILHAAASVTSSDSPVFGRRCPSSAVRVFFGHVLFLPAILKDFHQVDFRWSTASMSFALWLPCSSVSLRGLPSLKWLGVRAQSGWVIL